MIGWRVPSAESSRTKLPGPDVDVTGVPSTFSMTPRPDHRGLSAWRRAPGARSTSLAHRDILNECVGHGGTACNHPSYRMNRCILQRWDSASPGSRAVLDSSQRRGWLPLQWTGYPPSNPRGGAPPVHRRRLRGDDRRGDCCPCAAGVAPDTVYATVGRKPVLFRLLIGTCGDVLPVRTSTRCPPSIGTTSAACAHRPSRWRSWTASGHRRAGPRWLRCSSCWKNARKPCVWSPQRMRARATNIR